jgi:hypothetical protein
MFWYIIFWKNAPKAILNILDPHPKGQKFPDSALLVLMYDILNKFFNWIVSITEYNLALFLGLGGQVQLTEDAVSSHQPNKGRFFELFKICTGVLSYTMTSDRDSLAVRCHIPSVVSRYKSVYCYVTFPKLYTLQKLYQSWFISNASRGSLLKRLIEGDADSPAVVVLRKSTCFQETLSSIWKEHFLRAHSV